MKKHIEYSCEICGQRYNTPEAAEKCEQSELFDPSKLPAGIMFSHVHNYYVGIFAIPPQGARKESGNPHVGSVWTWACRTKNGDTLGDSKCGSGSLVKSGKSDIAEFIKRRPVLKEHVGDNQFNRMVSYLRSQNIQPFYYTELGDLIIVKQ